MRTKQVQGFNFNLLINNSANIEDIEIGDDYNGQNIVIDNIRIAISRLVEYYISNHNKLFCTRLTLNFPLSYDMYPSS